MPIAIGQKLPEATFAIMTADGPTSLTTAQMFSGRKVVVFAVPGAFTPTCDSAHVPSFVRTAAAIRAKGVDAIYCIATNDAHVMRRWGESTGANDAGIVMLADRNGAFATALGVNFNNVDEAMYNRSRRYSMLVENGKVTIYNPQIERGCEVSGGEHMLAQL